MRYVSNSLKIAAAPEAAIRAFTDARHLRAWWMVEDSLVEPRINGLYTLLWGISLQGIRYVSTGVITAYEPERLLHVGHYLYLNPERPPLGPLDLLIHAEAHPSGCTLSVAQGPYPEGRGEHWDWYYEAVFEAWPKALQTLKAYLEMGGHPPIAG